MQSDFLVLGPGRTLQLRRPPNINFIIRDDLFFKTHSHLLDVRVAHGMVVYRTLLSVVEYHYASVQQGARAVVYTPSHLTLDRTK